LAEKAIRTVVVYSLLMVLFWLTGQRGLGAMNTFGFIAIFLSSKVVQNAVIGNHTRLFGGIAVTLVAVNGGLNRLTAISPTADSSGDAPRRLSTVAASSIQIAPPRPAAKPARKRGAATNGNHFGQVTYGLLQPGGQLVLT
jgi:hypothetical protein